MGRRTLAGFGLVLVLMLLSPTVLAAAPSGTVVLLDRTYRYAGVVDDGVFFQVPPTDAHHHVVCYHRSWIVTTEGSWEAVVRDAPSHPVVVDSLANAYADGLEVRVLNQAVALGPGTAGTTWRLDVGAAGASRYVNVNLTFVDTVADCPPGG